MIWMTWRQFRPAAIAAGAALVALAAALAATRPALLSLYASAGLPACHAGCAADASRFIISLNASYNGTIYKAGIGIMHLVPAVIGVFWGAPLVARELDSGTFRLAWSQSVTRARWATVKLVLIGAAAMLTAGLMSLLIGWWSSPLYHAASQAGQNALSISRFSALQFSTHGIAPVGYAAFAFTLGTAAGVLLRRTIPAMAVTLAMFVAIQVLVPTLVRPHLIPPVQTTRTPSAAQLGTIFIHRDVDFSIQVTAISGQPGAWILGNSWVGAAGQTVTRLPAACETASYSSSAGALPSCPARHDVKAVVSYQPASRYWELQWAETALYLALAAGLGGLCYWAIRRRQRAA
jgi:ABC-2 family transporter protein